MDRGAWWATVYGVTKSRTRLSTHNNNALCASSNDSQCFLFGTGLSCGMWDLVSWPGIEPRPPRNWECLSHWTTKEVPMNLFLCHEKSRGKWWWLCSKHTKNHCILYNRRLSFMVHKLYLNKADIFFSRAETWLLFSSYSLLCQLSRL